MSGPNLVDKLITLGTCKPKIRTSLKRTLDKYDNYILGLSPSWTNPRRVLYITHVKECITFKEAWERGEQDETYRLKRGNISPQNSDPTRIHMNGDIIVHTTDGINYKFYAGVHENDWETYVIGGKQVDSKKDIYVVGNPNSSRYYGEKGHEFTETLLKKYWRGYPIMRSHRVLYGSTVDEIFHEIDFKSSPSITQ